MARRLPWASPRTNTERTLSLPGRVTESLAGCQCQWPPVSLGMPAVAAAGRGHCCRDWPLSAQQPASDSDESGQSEAHCQCGRDTRAAPGTRPGSVRPPSHPTRSHDRRTAVRRRRRPGPDKAQGAQATREPWTLTVPAAALAGLPDCHLATRREAEPEHSPMVTATNVTQGSFNLMMNGSSRRDVPAGPSDRNGRPAVAVPAPGRSEAGPAGGRGTTDGPGPTWTQGCRPEWHSGWSPRTHWPRTPTPPMVPRWQVTHTPRWQ